MNCKVLYVPKVFGLLLSFIRACIICHSVATLPTLYFMAGMLRSCDIQIFMGKYDKCPKTSYTKVSDKMANANSADPDQTAPV